MKRTWNIEQLREAVQKSKCISHVIRNLNLANSGSRDVVIKAIEENKIDISHFWTDKERNEERVKWTSIQTPLEELLVENSKTVRCQIKRRLLKEGYKKNICEICGQKDVWHGQKMSMVLDHINGVNDDNRLSNLRIICPNCSYTLPTNGGKNVKKNKRYNFCASCNKEVPCAKKYCSIECKHIGLVNSEYAIGRRKVERPPLDVLLKEIELLGYCGTGRKYNVSDQAIRKWVKAYKLPCSVTGNTLVSGTSDAGSIPAEVTNARK